MRTIARAVSKIKVISLSSDFRNQIKVAVLTYLKQLYDMQFLKKAIVWHPEEFELADLGSILSFSVEMVSMTMSLFLWR